MRLAKYLARGGVSSRRAAEELVRAGRVTVDGNVVRDPARDVADASVIAVDGDPVTPETPVVYAVHKPAGVVSTARDPRGRPTVVDLVAAEARLYPVGRLDADTTGLILLTNDGELANLLTHPRFEVPKTYRATVANAPVGERARRALREGVRLDDGLTAPAGVRPVGREVLEVTIHEGRKHQVRRMCEAVGHPVRELQRIRFGPLGLDDLAPGEHRRLTDDEVASLREAARPRG